MQTETNFSKAVATEKKKPDSIGAEYEIARQQFHLFTRAYDAGHKEYLDIKKKCNDFYIGGLRQWDPSDLAKLAAEGRPALTINMILSTVNVVLGEQIGRRVDIQYKARKDATAESAISLTKLAMAVCDANQFHWLESQVFADGLIEERGWYDVRMNFDDNIEGEAEITSVDPGDVIPDPDGLEYDPKTWKEVWRTRWYSIEEIEASYGKEKADSLMSIAENGGHFGNESIRRLKNTFGDVNSTNTASFQHMYDEKEDRFLLKVRVIERQFFKNTLVYSLINPQSGEKRDLPPGTTKEIAKQLADSFQVAVHQQIKPRVYWRITADRYVLHDEWSIYKSFTLVPYFPYFRRGTPFGMVRNLLSPQEQLNKLSSQELHIVNTTANSGYIVEKGALHGMTADELRANGSKTGVVIEVNPGRMGGIEKIKPNTIPTGIDRITQKSANNIKEISGVSDAIRGMETGEVSGVALESKERRGQVQIQVPIDNLSRTRHLVARKLLELFHDFYTNERIVYYTNDMEPGQPSESITVNEMQEDGSIKNDITTGVYDIVISTLPARDNFRDTQFAEALNLRNVGVRIPDYRVIQYSNLAHKDEVANEVRQLEGLGETSPEQQAMQERQMEATIADLEAEVQKKLAAAQELNTKAELNVAKAKETAASPELVQRGMEYKDVADKRGIDLRERLGTLSAINKLDVTDLATRLKNGAKK